MLTYTYFFNVLARERRAKSRSKLKLSVQLKRERCLIVTAVMLVPDLIHDQVGENKPSTLFDGSYWQYIENTR